MAKIEYDCKTCGRHFTANKSRLSEQCDACEEADRRLVWKRDELSFSDAQLRAILDDGISHKDDLTDEQIMDLEAHIWGPNGAAAKIRAAKAKKHYRPNGTVIPPTTEHSRAPYIRQMQEVDMHDHMTGMWLNGEALHRCE